MGAGLVAQRLQLCFYSREKQAFVRLTTLGSMLGMSKCMVFDFKPGQSTSDHNNFWVAEFQSVHLQCLHPQFRFFNKHGLQISFWRLRTRAAVSLTHACHRIYPTESAEGSTRLLFRMH